MNKVLKIPYKSKVGSKLLKGHPPTSYLPINFLFLAHFLQVCKHKKVDKIRDIFVSCFIPRSNTPPCFANIRVDKHFGVKLIWNEFETAYQLDIKLVILIRCQTLYFTLSKKAIYSRIYRRCLSVFLHPFRDKVLVFKIWEWIPRLPQSPFLRWAF